MADIVHTAITTAARDHRTDEKTIWSVALVTKESCSGTIEALGSGCYKIMKDNQSRPIYFQSDQVVYLMPQI